ncbi:triose-phosphate isomerase [bacterium]|nr:triose-phosphate isomerase [bacterium]
MGRRKFIAGNWKMNTSRESAVQLARQLAAHLGRVEDVDIALCPPACYLLAVHEEIAGTRLALGAQNMHHEKSGAFTGEVSPVMLCDCHCTHVIIGHSERRQFFGEDDELVNRKIIAALSHNLNPIVCVGESLDQRESGKTMEVVGTQLRHALVGVRPEQLRDVTIAYEPIWAIGTGRVASPEQAEQVHAHLRSVLTSMYGADLSMVIRIQYGGSVKGDNAAGILAQPNVDGALVGGASLKAEEFIAIVLAGVPA